MLGLQAGRAGPIVNTLVLNMTMFILMLNMTMFMLVLNRTMFILVLNMITLFPKRLCLQLTTVQTEVVNQDSGTFLQRERKQTSLDLLPLCSALQIIKSAIIARKQL